MACPARYDTISWLLTNEHEMTELTQDQWRDLLRQRGGFEEPDLTTAMNELKRYVQDDLTVRLVDA